MAPSDPRRDRYVQLLQEMAAALLPLQRNDGLWSPNLLDPAEYPYPETSGTGFFTYALAWGINQGHLDRTTYLPVVTRAWYGLVDAVNDEGKLGWVQQPWDRPRHCAARGHLRSTESARSCWPVAKCSILFSNPILCTVKPLNNLSTES